MDKINEVSIKIQTGVYGQFRNLNNRVWFALAEYVDNAVQSFEDNKIQLLRNNSKYQLEVKIYIDLEKSLIRIRDNAAGIDSRNFKRAFEPANIPIDNTGLNEFGMGMKTASIWLADLWSVRTAAIGEGVERFVEFDLKKVLEEEEEVLKVKETKKVKTEHFTELVLRHLSKNAPNAHQTDKIKRHLVSIYRKYIRSGQMKLFVNDEMLNYEDPEILFAPLYTNSKGKPIEWKKSIQFSAGKYKVDGFIAILNTMSSSGVNGFSLFRRNRVIEGSHDEKYRPKILCGNVGSPRYKRIFGEFELEGFTVSFNKGSFQEHEDLEALMKAIRTQITDKNFDILTQAEKYIKPKAHEDNKTLANGIVKDLKKESKKEPFNNKIAKTIEKIEEKPLRQLLIKKKHKVRSINSYEDKFMIKDDEYKFKMELITSNTTDELYSLIIDKDSNQVTYRINLAHPIFVKSHRMKTQEDYRPIILLIRSFVIAEILSMSQGTSNAGNVRTNFNKIIKEM